MENVNLVTIIVAVLGAGGLGAFAREIADIASKVRRGVSTRESNRKNDIIAQRDAALAREKAEQQRADAERHARIGWQGYAGTLAFRLRSSGVIPDALPDDLEDTLNPKKT
ncbi:hypothetical protein [Microbacterium galbinum]|uniref:hypothetical protein n=1 Tax=Microbacterium galbinum TaxID=2851646 RepID=UPI001FFC9E82|nr:hypothetical protein [Microbacterium galbinum]MCK2031255.1 hypothetical protein [Microbacterium galbinum]